MVTNQESEGPIQSQELYMCVCVGGGRDTTMAVFRAGNLQSLLHILCGHLTTDYKELRTQKEMYPGPSQFINIFSTSIHLI